MKFLWMVYQHPLTDLFLFVLLLRWLHLARKYIAWAHKLNDTWEDDSK